MAKRRKKAPEIKESVTNSKGQLTQGILKEYKRTANRLRNARSLKKALRNVILPLASKDEVEVEEGKLNVAVRVIEKTSVDWRAEFVKVAGEKKARQLENRKSNTKTEKHLIVE